MNIVWSTTTTFTAGATVEKCKSYWIAGYPKNILSMTVNSPRFCAEINYSIWAVFVRLWWICLAVERTGSDGTFITGKSFAVVEVAKYHSRSTSLSGWMQMEVTLFYKSASFFTFFYYYFKYVVQLERPLTHRGPSSGNEYKINRKSCTRQFIQKV